MAIKYNNTYVTALTNITTPGAVINKVTVNGAEVFPSPAYDITHIAYSGKQVSLDDTGLDDNGKYYGIGLSANGLKLWAYNDPRTNIYTANLGTAFDIATASGWAKQNILGSPACAYFTSNGKNLIIDSYRCIVIRRLSTAYNVANVTSTTTTPTQSNYATEVFLSDNGVWQANMVSSKLNMYQLTTPFDMSTRVLHSTLNATKSSSFTFSLDGRWLLYGNKRMFHLSTPWDLNTARESSHVLTNIEFNHCVYLAPDGKKVLLINGSSSILTRDYIKEYLIP